MRVRRAAARQIPDARVGVAALRSGLAGRAAGAAAEAFADAMDRVAAQQVCCSSQL